MEVKDECDWYKKEQMEMKSMLQQCTKSIKNNKEENVEKDKIINELKDQVGTLRESKNQQNIVMKKKLKGMETIRRIVTRVEIRNRIWCCLEYHNEDEDSIFEWREFNKEDEVREFIQQSSGEPLIIPPSSLTPAEAELVVI